MPKSNDRDRLSKAPGSGTLPPPRDPEIAVREEYEIAIKRGTVEAIELFVQRHAAHPLAEEAQRALKRQRAAIRR